MLLFPIKPDPVFLAILHDALELRRDELRTFIESGATLEEWEIGNPMLATHFSPDLVVDVISRLLAASQDTIVYRPNDYHWLVIYDCLARFCAVHNDLVAEEPTRITSGRGPSITDDPDHIAIRDRVREGCRGRWITEPRASLAGLLDP